MCRRCAGHNRKIPRPRIGRKEHAGNCAAYGGHCGKLPWPRELRGIKLSVMIDRAADRLTTAVEDNGRGMDADTLYRCTDPFMTTRTARRVGLGLALFKLSAEQSGGSSQYGASRAAAQGRRRLISYPA